jgi:imidazolonepropionase-like amidohydrolase
VSPSAIRIAERRAEAPSPDPVVVREQLRARAEVIRICASGEVISERNDPQHEQFTSGEVAAIVEVAGLADRSVMAHCHGATARLAAVEVASGMTPKMADVYADSGERIARAHACGIRIAMGTDVRRGGARGPGRAHPCPAGG